MMFEFIMARFGSKPSSGVCDLQARGPVSHGVTWRLAPVVPLGNGVLALMQQEVLDGCCSWCSAGASPSVVCRMKQPSVTLVPGGSWAVSAVGVHAACPWFSHLWLGGRGGHCGELRELLCRPDPSGLGSLLQPGLFGAS